MPPVGSGRDPGQSCGKFSPGIEFDVNMYTIKASSLHGPWICSCKAYLESRWIQFGPVGDLIPIFIIRITYRFAMLTDCRLCMECLKAATFTAADKPGPRVGSWILSKYELMRISSTTSITTRMMVMMVDHPYLDPNCASVVAASVLSMACHLLVDRESRLVVGVSN